ncbi:MAG: hypothetical protein V3R81_11925 [Gammaproteobacteria bacterium]
MLGKTAGYSTQSYISSPDDNLVIADIPAMSCATCQIAAALNAAPRCEFSPGYPCQQGVGATYCRLAVAPGDAVVIYIGRHQADAHAIEDGAATYYNDVELFKTALEAWAEAHPEAGERDKKDDTPEATTAADAGRARIRSYMHWHDKKGWLIDHPLAARCGDCEHKRSNSPIKDSSAPHCEWARGRKKVAFHVWMRSDESNIKIPWCQQFAPRLGWADILPEYPGKMPFQRDWFYALIDQHADTYRYNSYTGSTGMLETLTGRPMKSTENHTEWFGQQFEQYRDSLSDGQLVTLFLLVMAYWSHQRDSRGHVHDVLIPMPGGLIPAWKLQDWPEAPLFFEPK